MEGKWERKENGRRENGEEIKWERKCYPSSCLDGWGKIERKENGWVRWDMVIGQCCATFLSLIIPPFWEEKLGRKMGHMAHPLFLSLFLSSPSKQVKILPPPHFPLPFSFLSHFPSIQAHPERLRRGMTVDPTCQSCNGGVEDFDHLFKFCNLAASIWSRLQPIGMRNSFSSLDIISWLKFYLLSALPRT